VVSDSQYRASEDYVPALFERFKDAHFESRLMMAFARNFDWSRSFSTINYRKGNGIFRRAIGLPWLPYVQGMPQSVNVSLWGIIGAIGCHTRSNVLPFIIQK
jgi:hypothetical protein